MLCSAIYISSPWNIWLMSHASHNHNTKPFCHLLRLLEQECSKSWGIPWTLATFINCSWCRFIKLLRHIASWDLKGPGSAPSSNLNSFMRLHWGSGLSVSIPFTCTLIRVTWLSGNKHSLLSSHSIMSFSGRTASTVAVFLPQKCPAGKTGVQ